ncbi:MAG: flagellar export protein FliJ [Candidatus Kuenenia sp.]|nr:flagellar export protein FliJ [Candidatus Kuenenia hertensis]
MKFRFKFQKLLDLEKFREEEIAKELKKVQKKLHEEQKMELLLKSLLETRQSEMTKMLQTYADASAFVLFESYFTKLNGDIIAQRSKIKKISEEVEQVRQRLLSVFKKRKLLEKLRERHVKEFDDQEKRLESKKLDEIATNRFYYKHVRQKDVLE